MVTGDATYIKKVNRDKILHTILLNRKISRAEISKLTKLNKATVSSQVAELLERKLVVESSQDHFKVGRKPIMVSINREAGCVLGIDVDNDSMITTLADALGEPLETSTKPLTTTNYVDVVKELAALINSYDLKCSDYPYGLTSVVIAIHGSVRTDEVVTFVPQFEWSQKPLKQDLTQLVAVDITIENNANLCAIAEHLHSHPYTNHLLTMTMQSGIGLGMMMEGNLIKGHHGYAGEIGHMVLYPNGEPCKCGNKGCFELYASERHFLEKLGNGQKMPIESFVQQLHLSNISQEVEDFLTDIAAGLNNVINFYNPEIVVINSELLSNIPNAVDRITAKLISTMIDYKLLVISSLGIKASVYGACALASRRFLDLSFNQDAIDY